ncbi:MAG: hypothetical protein KBB88_02000 [Candidatus Pacebacteria bacterium]|nr:hypothetical protein [Candidatus Paceibacterota bacterium]
MKQNQRKMKSKKIFLAVAMICIVTKSTFAQSPENEQKENNYFCMYSVQKLINEYENIQKLTGHEEYFGIDTVYLQKFAGTFVAIDSQKKQVYTNVKEFIAVSDMEGHLLAVEDKNFHIYFSEKKGKYLGNWTDDSKMSAVKIKKK